VLHALRDHLLKQLGHSLKQRDGSVRLGLCVVGPVGLGNDHHDRVLPNGRVVTQGDAGIVDRSEGSEAGPQPFLSRAQPDARRCLGRMLLSVWLRRAKASSDVMGAKGRGGREGGSSGKDRGDITKVLGKEPLCEDCQTWSHGRK
jgi:hypothetical protein